MQVYSIYVKKNNNFDLNDDIEIIDQKFSFFAAFLPIFWCIYHRLWKLAIILAIAFFFISSYLDPLESIILGIYFGFVSANLKEYFLERQGYFLGDIIVSYSNDLAYLEYLNRNSDNEKTIIQDENIQ
jgi:hypothetical protein